MFDTPPIRTAIECLRSLNTTSRNLTEYEIDPSEYPSIAAVGYEGLTTLERSILPAEYDVVEIIDRSEHALTVPGSRKETVDTADVLSRVVSLEAETDWDGSRIEAIQHEEEHEAILSKIADIVGNDAYAVRDGGELRPPDYDDIAGPQVATQSASGD